MADTTSAAIAKLIADRFPGDLLASDFLARIRNGEPTRDENPESHFCVYFAAYDPNGGRVFLGLHLKSGLWLFNGGHIDRNETPETAVIREIREEWGVSFSTAGIGTPKLLSITAIDNPTKQRCRTHYDIWYFIAADPETFVPDPVLLAREFHENAWLTADIALERVTDPATKKAIVFLKKME